MGFTSCSLLAKNTIKLVLDIGILSKEWRNNIAYIQIFFLGLETSIHNGI